MDAQFLRLLFARSAVYRERAKITLTAIHPAGHRRSPSRHIALQEAVLLKQSLKALKLLNEQGWGAFYSVGLRRKGLQRFQRGGISELIALPALFADVDDKSPQALSRLRELDASSIVFSGGGYHAYWFLKEPMIDFQYAKRILRALAQRTRGDPLSPAQSLRLPGSYNTKVGREMALCHVQELAERYYDPQDFDYLLPLKRKTYPARPRMPPNDLRHIVTDYFIRSGYKRRGDWLNGSCIYPENHRNGDKHPSFGFNSRTAYGNCFICGSMPVKDIYTQLVSKGKL